VVDEPLADGFIFVGAGIEDAAVYDAMEERVRAGDGAEVGGQEFADLVGELADDRPDWLFRVSGEDGQEKTYQFGICLHQGEGVLAGTDFLGNAVEFVVKDVAEAFGRDEGEDVVLVFRCVLGSADGAGGCPDPGFEGFVVRIGRFERINCRHGFLYLALAKPC
jgi:hypothetical protein